MSQLVLIGLVGAAVAVPGVIVRSDLRVGPPPRAPGASG